LSPYRSIEPIKLFDNLYFVGTTTVGAFIVDSGDGLVMLDTGNGDADIAMMVEDMKKSGLDPSRIKLIFISHEHFDHYGGVQYLKRNICPDAKVAMSLTGWNLLQTVPSEWAYIGTRPQSIDIYLLDGMKIKTGTMIFQIIATPGHSPGCLSFIFPVTDNGKPTWRELWGDLPCGLLRLKQGFTNLRSNILKHLLRRQNAMLAWHFIRRSQICSASDTKSRRTKSVGDRAGKV